MSEPRDAAGPLEDEGARERAEDLVREMDEGAGAGPGAPETVEPRTGRPGGAGKGPKGPGGPAPETMSEGA